MTKVVFLDILSCIMFICLCVLFYFYWNDIKSDADHGEQLLWFYLCTVADGIPSHRAKRALLRHVIGRRRSSKKAKAHNLDQMLGLYKSSTFLLASSRHSTFFFPLVSITMAPRKYFIHSAHYSLCLINATLEIRKVQFSISCLSLQGNPFRCNVKSSLM